MAQAIFPHRVASAGAVRAESWYRMHSSGASEKIEGHISDFDAGTGFKAVRAVRVNSDQVRESCQLDGPNRLSVLAKWYSVRTELRGIGRAVELASGENDVEVAIDVPAGHSGGTLVLRTSLILAAPSGSQQSPFSASMPGAILWQDRVDVVLEGSGPRFPVDIRKFESAPLSGAGWMLDWRPGSPEAMFMGSVRLLLNERHKAVVEAAMSVIADHGQRMIKSAINVDVARSLICGMLRNPEFVNGGARYEKGTVGQVVGDLIAATFPGEDLSTVSAQLANEPETFAARLQSRFRLFSVG